MSDLTALQCIAYTAVGSFIGCAGGSLLFFSDNFERSYLKAKRSYAKDSSELNFNIVDLYYRAFSFKLKKKYAAFAVAALHHYSAIILKEDIIGIKKLYAEDLNWYLKTLRKMKSKVEYKNTIDTFLALVEIIGISPDMLKSVGVEFY